MGKLDLRAIGEFGLIEALRRRARASPRWREGIGDDAAVLRPRAGRELVLTSDALIEDVHFRWRGTSPAALARKALMVNLSDLSAMGAEPLGFLLALGLPARTRAERLDGFVTGLLRAASDTGCPLVGGDTVRAPVWTLAVTAVGELPSGSALRRAGARAGQRILVTGELGAAALGLFLLERGRGGTRSARPFLRRQRDPAPPWRAGAILRRGGLATAAIDISDGLAQDLGHLLRASGVAADLELERLPLPRGFARHCAQHGLDPVQLALAGGEDYELLFCAPARGPSAARLAARLGCRVTEIGRTRKGRGLALFRGGVRVSAPAGGFEHFKTP